MMCVSSPLPFLRRSVFRASLLLSCCALWLLLALAAGAQTLTAETKAKVLKGMEDVLTRRAFAAGTDYSKWPAFLEKHRADIDKTEDANAFAREVNRALREFGTSHIRFLTPRSATARNRTSTTGLGIMARKVNEGLQITGLVPAGPAADSGLEIGDVILEADGILPETTDTLGKDEDVRVALKVHKKDGSERYISVERKTYATVRQDSLKWLDSETALLRVNTFSLGYNRANIEKFMTEAAKAKYLILDLRSNGGGAVVNMRHLLSLLLPDGSPIGTSVSRNMADRYAMETKGDPKDAIAIAKWAGANNKTAKRDVAPFTGKIAVLINRGSGSASEITSAALRENVKALLVGTRSAGAVLVSIFGRLPEGFELQYPVSDYITAQGNRLEGHPLIPDLEVTAPTTPNGPDPVVERAAIALHASVGNAKTAETKTVETKPGDNKGNQ